MRVRTFIKFVYKEFGRIPFTSRQVFKGHYNLYPGSMGAVYNVVHKCWKMGLLRRKKLWGNRYEYWVTDWGVRYVEEGYYFRQNEVWIKLLTYIVKYGDEQEKKWAEKVLAPQLLQRFFPGRKAQSIDPLLDIYEAAENVAETLKTRIKDETIIPDNELVLDRLDDSIILILVGKLMEELHPRVYTPLDFKKIHISLIEVIHKFLNEVKNPREYTTIRHLDTHLNRGRMKIRDRLKPNIEDRPNPKELAKLEKVKEKLESLLEREITMLMETDRDKTNKQMEAFLSELLKFKILSNRF
ncbi:hypothetical protein KAS14_07105 [Candidatus Bathyarchaeota archaeon]|nr:hypothetical protein [Candidatus Bathyarchaeota archaeon]